LRVEIFERIAHRSSHDALGIDIYDRGQHFSHGQNGWFRSWIGLRKYTCRSSEENSARSGKTENKFATGLHFAGASNETLSRLSTCRPA